MSSFLSGRVADDAIIIGTPSKMSIEPVWTAVSGDELVGLTRAFIYAGTPSVVASLWKVDDASTAHLMSSFYGNLRTKTKVESLRQAQLDMIRGKVTDPLLAQRGVGGIGKLGQTPAAASFSQASISTSHPYFWAPFILIGDGK
jgi:CHAT domain-containing protein